MEGRLDPCSADPDPSRGRRRIDVRFALRNTHAVVVAALAVIVLGITAHQRIPADLLPIFRTPAVQIVTFYPGMPPEVFVGWKLSLEKLSRISERRAEQRSAEFAALCEEERAVGEALRALHALESARERMPLARKGLEAAQENHRISLARFKGGTAIALEVLVAEDQLALARLELARAIVEFNLSQLRLLAASGALERAWLAGSGLGGS